jgi:hypothetical protein
VLVSLHRRLMSIRVIDLVPDVAINRGISEFAGPSQFYPALALTGKRQDTTAVGMT